MVIIPQSFGFSTFLTLKGICMDCGRYDWGWAHLSLKETKISSQIASNIAAAICNIKRFSF